MEQRHALATGATMRGCQNPVRRPQLRASGRLQRGGRDQRMSKDQSSVLNLEQLGSFDLGHDVQGETGPRCRLPEHS